MNDDECNDEKSKAKEKAPDSGGFPWMDCTSPLKSKQQADDGTNEEDGAQNIDLLNFLYDSEPSKVAFGWFEEEQDSDERTGTEW